MTLRVFSREFFSNYIFHHDAKELSAKDQRKALISSIFFGIITIGICHLVCLIKYRNRTFKLVAKNEILDNLIKFAEKEDGAFLIDFSKVNPSNIFKIFDKDSNGKLYGDAWISDEVSSDENDKFKHNFPFKYAIRAVVLEKNEYGYCSYTGYKFTMNAEGKVESYGEVFDNFNDYLENRMNAFSHDARCPFTHFDFYSPWNNDQRIKLRKKII